jgi:pimeloyl-ACP methyl ester carboxylesterase
MQMKEAVFEVVVNSETIYGIWYQPVECKKKTAVVMLHGWAGYRTGPHDMLVKMARNLTVKGYDCFRFDFRGKGYSQGDRQKTNNRSMLADLEAVLRYVNHVLECPQIVLTGICSGARLALYYARSGCQPIKHVIEMSSPVLRQNEVEVTLATNQAKSTLEEYAKKVFRIETWGKLVGGGVHFSAVWRNINRPVMRLFAKKIKKNAPISHHAVPQTQETPFGKFQGQMLLIHGEKDPETQPALEQIHRMLQSNQIQSDTHIVKNANHSFYSLAWEKEIIELITDWLSNR